MARKTPPKETVLLPDLRSEARMRAGRYPWIILTLALITTGGCRGPKPMGGGLVQVTEDSSVDVSDVEPLPQRLASAHTSNGPNESSDHPETGSAATKLVQQAAARRDAGNLADRVSAKPVSARQTKPAAKPKSDTALLEDLTRPNKRPAARSTESKLASQHAPKVPQRRITSASPNKPAATERKVAATRKNSFDAFADSSPKVQAAAIRRFVSAVARQADRTTQPKSLHPALAKSLKNLPTLPAAKNIQAKLPPNRLAAGPAKPPRKEQTESPAAAESGSMEVVHVTDISPDLLSSNGKVAAQPEPAPADTDPATPEPPAPEPELPAVAVAEPAESSEPIQARTALLPLTLPMDLQSPVVQAGGSDGQQEEMVRAAAATDSDPTKVAQAVGVPSLDEIPLPPLSLATPVPSGDLVALKAGEIDAEMLLPTETPTETQPTDLADDVGTNPNFLSDEELYRVLLARLTTPAVGETEAEKSRRLIMARHLMVLAGQHDQAGKKLEGLSEQEQKYLQHHLAGLWKMIDPAGHPVTGRRFSSALPELREATKYLAAATDSLEVKSLSFCTEIESFGQVKKFPANRFQAGQQVILYCEVENFAVEKVDAGFETHLQGSYDVFNSENEKVVSQLLPADRQVASKYLRDYFIAYQMHLPKELKPGSYRLQLTIEDVAGKKYGQASVPVEIAE